MSRRWLSWALEKLVFEEELDGMDGCCTVNSAGIASDEELLGPGGTPI